MEIDAFPFAPDTVNKQQILAITERARFRLRARGGVHSVRAQVGCSPAPSASTVPRGRPRALGGSAPAGGGGGGAGSASPTHTQSF